MRAGTLALLGVCLGGGGAAPAQPAPEDLASRVDAYLGPLVAAGQLSGTLLLAADGVVQYRRTLGARTPGGVPLTADTPLYVASLTKPVTLLLAVQLAAEGVVQLDDPVSQWLPGLPGGDVMTLDQLLRHRSGIPHRLLPDSAQHRHRDMAQLVDAAARGPRDFPAGTGVKYSSGGYTVAAAVLERATGQSYAELLQRRVAAPVGATHTGDASTGPVPGGAWGQYLLPTGPSEAHRRDLSHLVGGGSLYTTADDVLRIVRGIVDGGYGPAVRTRLLDTAGNLAWDGATSGHRAFVRHDGASGTTVVFVGNLHTGAVNLLRRDIPRIGLGEAVAPPEVRLPAARPAPAAERAAVEGWYHLGWDQPLRFPGGSVAWLGDWPLWHVGEGRYYWPQDGEMVEVEADATGGVAALVAHGAWRASRVVRDTGSVRGGAGAGKVSVEYRDRRLDIRTADGNWRVHVQWRFQFRFSDPLDGTPEDAADLASADAATFRVRRGRLKVGGHAYRPWLDYYLEYNFPSSDLLDWRLTIGSDQARARVGQWKVNYSRERVSSSGTQQFVERSIVNETFTLDRQQGVMGMGHLAPGSHADLRWYAGTFTGTGANESANDDAHLLWLGRVEWQPLGRDPGMEAGALERHDALALTVAAAAATNRSPYTRFATSGPGQLAGYADGAPGQYRVRQAMLETAAKYRGFSWWHESHWKQVHDHGTGEESELRGTYVQAGWFPSGVLAGAPRALEVAARWAAVDGGPVAFDRRQREVTAAANWFFDGHLNKLSLDLSRLTFTDPTGDTARWRLRAQWDISF